MWRIKKDFRAKFTLALESGIVYYTGYMNANDTESQPFGDYIRQRRLALLEHDRSYSVRKVAARLGVQPAYLSKVELGQVGPTSEATTRKLAEVLGEDPDVLLALAGKVSSDLQEAIRRRPRLFAELIRELKDAPDPAVQSVVREAQALYQVKREE